MSTYSENKNYENSSLFQNASEEEKKQFAALLEFAATMPPRGSNWAPKAGCRFKITGVPESLPIPGTDRKWTKFPTKLVDSDDDGEGGGISLSRLQGHPSPTFWNGPNGVELIEIAPNDILEKFGVSVKHIDNARSKIDVNLKGERVELLKLPRSPYEVRNQMIRDLGKFQYMILATAIVQGTSFDRKYSLITRVRDKKWSEK